MAILEREALIHYLDVLGAESTNPSFTHKKITDVTTSSASTWEVIGDDIEEMNVELNTDTSQFKNILGQTKVKDNGYTPSISAEPFYADPSSSLYKILRDIALDRKKNDACRALMLEVLVEDTTATSHLAYVSEVVVKPSSYGGNATDGVNIPFTIMENGDRVKGTVTLSGDRASNYVPVFTKAST